MNINFIYFADSIEYIINFYYLYLFLMIIKLSYADSTDNTICDVTITLPLSISDSMNPYILCASFISDILIVNIFYL